MRTAIWYSRLAVVFGVIALGNVALADSNEEPLPPKLRDISLSKGKTSIDADLAEYATPQEAKAIKHKFKVKEVGGAKVSARKLSKR